MAPSALILHGGLGHRLHLALRVRPGVPLPVVALPLVLLRLRHLLHPVHPFLLQNDALRLLLLGHERVELRRHDASALVQGADQRQVEALEAQ
eukprot:1426819-Pyramimonas_sp.AAC.1